MSAYQEANVCLDSRVFQTPFVKQSGLGNHLIGVQISDISFTFEWVYTNIGNSAKLQYK